MTEDPWTMEVFCHGEKTTRRVSHYEPDDSPFQPANITIQRPVPVLKAGEGYAWTLAGTCHILEIAIDGAEPHE